MRHITAKSIDVTGIHPKLHSLHHFTSKLMIIIIEINYILPTMAVVKTAFLVSFIEAGIGFCPDMIPTGMICYPVNDYFKTQFMCFFYKVPEVLNRSKFRIGIGIIRTGIITAKNTKSFFTTYRGNGHKP